MVLRIVVAVAAFAGLSACKGKSSAPPKPLVPELALQAVEKSNASLIASAAVPSIEGTLDEVGRMGKALGLPFGKDELRAMATQRSGLPENVLATLALDKPIGFAMVGRPQPGGDPFAAVALALKEQAGPKLIAALGTKSGGKDDAIEISRPDGSKVWLVVRGDVVVAADSVDALVAAGAQAMAARTTLASDDLVVRVSPDGIARSQGTDVKTALGDFQTKMATLAASQGGSGADPALTRATFAPLVAFVGDLDRADLGLRVDEKRGVAFFVRAHPKAGSQLEKDLVGGAPARIDPSLLVGPAPAVVVAMTHSPWIVTYYRGYLQGLADAKLPLYPELEKLIGSFADTTGSSGVGRMGARGIEFESVMTTKEGGGAALLDSLGAFMSAPAMKSLLARATGAAAKGVKVTWKRQGDSARVDMSLPKGLPQAEAAMLKSMFGGNTITLHVAGSGGRLATAMGPSAPARAKALLAPAGTASSAWPELAPLLAELSGEHGWAYIDLMQLVRPIMSAAAERDPGAAQVGAMMNLPMFADLRLPLVESWRGDKELDFEFRVPMLTLTNAANAARPFLGGQGGGAVAPAP